MGAVAHTSYAEGVAAAVAAGDGAADDGSYDGVDGDGGY